MGGDRHTQLEPSAKDAAGRSGRQERLAGAPALRRTGQIATHFCVAPLYSTPQARRRQD